jgi:hypothetical protein
MDFCFAGTGPYLNVFFLFVGFVQTRPIFLE